MLVYQKPELSDEDAITEMYETYLNDGPGIRAYIRKGLENEGLVGIKCVDTDTGRLVGIIASRPGLEFTYPHPELEAEITARWGSKGVYSSDVMIVDPNYRHRGVARELSLRLREGLLSRNAVCIVMELWIRPDGEIPALHPVNFLGEPTVITISRDFYKDLGKYGLTCPECGTDCRCGAMIAAIDFRRPWSKESTHEEKK